MDRVLDGLEDQLATEQIDGGSSFAWTLGHVTSQVDAWINVRFGRRHTHHLIGDTRFNVGGTGSAQDWQAIRHGVYEVREGARSFLANEGDSDQVVAYDGSFVHLRKSRLSLYLAIIRISAHHYFHIGEIASKRNALGHQVGDYPSPWNRWI